MLTYLVRHAESFANSRPTEDLDSGLSPLGGQQTLALARRFSTCPLSAIYSSPFRRCLETAQPIARQLALPVFIRPELSEYHHKPPGSLPDFPLGPVDSILSGWQSVAPCPDHDGPFEWPALDETLDSLHVRTRRFANFLKSRWPQEDHAILIISHGSPIARIIDAWLTDQPGPSYRFIIDNAAVAALRFHNHVSSLVCLNEISHLRSLPPPVASNYLSDGAIRAIPPTSYR